MKRNERVTTFDQLWELRREFGTGLAGERAFLLITNGVKCGAFTQKSKPCKKQAVETVDFDVFGELDQIPSCGNKHTALIQKKIDKDLRERKTIFGRNGNGRA